MYQYDLAIYGHITVDRIINNFKEEVSLGAIANFWSALNKIKSSTKFKLVPCAMGEAVIIVNEKTSQRFGRGNLNLETVEPSVVNAEWHHVMYLNQLKNKDFIRDLDGIISADLTAGKMDILDDLVYIDYLFLSEEDLFMDLNKLANLVKGCVILHYPSGSICADGKTQIECKTEVKKNINVLGAGDTFAACFISNMLKNNDIESSLKYAHDKTLKVLLDEN